MALRPIQRQNKTPHRLPTLSRSMIKTLLVASLAASLGGCGSITRQIYHYINPGNSFLDPSQVGRFDRDHAWGDVRPVKWPILEELDVVDEPVDRWASATDPTPADIVADNKEYVVGPGDILRITVFELVEPQRDYIKDPAPVNESGDIALQNLGDVKVAGLTSTQIEQKIGQVAIERHLLLPRSETSQGPQVSVTLAQSASRQFSILGNVTQPYTYAIIGNEFRLLDALAIARDIPGGAPYGIDYLYVIRRNTPKNTLASPAAPPPPDVMNPNPTPAPTESNPAPTGNPLDALDSLQKNTTEPAPQSAPAPAVPPAESLPAPTPATNPGVTGPVFVRPLPTAEVVSSGAPATTAQSDLDAAISGTASTAPAAATIPANAVETASAPATQPVVATTVPGDDLMNQAMGATSRPGQNVYIDGKWVTLPASNTTMPQETGLAGSTTGPSTMPAFEEAATTAASQPDAFAAAEAANGQRVIRIPVNALREGNPRYNIIIRPGDTIVVPGIDQGFFYMEGHVNKPGVYQINGQKITLTQAVAAAGNLDALAIPWRCDLIRRIGTNQQVIVQVNLKAIFDGTQPDIFLKSNDVVNIGTDLIAPFLAVTRNAYRASYGFGFIYDRNFYIQPTRTQ